MHGKKGALSILTHHCMITCPRHIADQLGDIWARFSVWLARQKPCNCSWPRRHIIVKAPDPESWNVRCLRCIAHWSLWEYRMIDFQNRFSSGFSVDVPDAEHCLNHQTLLLNKDKILPKCFCQLLQAWKSINGRPLFSKKQRRLEYTSRQEHSGICNSKCRRARV